jgi:hypothetical protein
MKIQSWGGAQLHVSPQMEEEGIRGICRTVTLARQGSFALSITFQEVHRHVCREK